MITGKKNTVNFFKILAELIDVDPRSACSADMDIEDLVEEYESYALEIVEYPDIPLLPLFLGDDWMNQAENDIDCVQLLSQRLEEILN